jgi:hypothetical protein
MVGAMVGPTTAPTMAPDGDPAGLNPTSPRRWWGRGTGPARPRDTGEEAADGSGPRRLQEGGRGRPGCARLCRVRRPPSTTPARCAQSAAHAGCAGPGTVAQPTAQGATVPLRNRDCASFGGHRTGRGRPDHESDHASPVRLLPDRRSGTPGVPPRFSQQPMQPPHSSADQRAARRVRGSLNQGKESGSG